jgi:hypothetical protein
MDKADVPKRLSKRRITPVLHEVDLVNAKGAQTRRESGVKGV